MSPKIRPTLRKNGRYMCTVRVPIDVGIVEIIEAMIYHRVVYSDPIPTSRQRAMTLAVKHYKERAMHSNPAALDDEGKQQMGTMCAIKAAELFPDLAAGVDLAEYSLTRVVDATPAQQQLPAAMTSRCS